MVKKGSSGLVHFINKDEEKYLRYQFEQIQKNEKK
jgi:hypothetical protein